VSNIKILQSLKSQEFYKSLGIKRVKVDNDAHCFALAEAKFGKGKNFNNFIGITLGTGIGGGIILSRRLFLGSHMTAGHIGYVMAGLKDSAEDVYQKFKDKNNVKGIGLVAGIIIANAINLLDLEGVVLGGSVAEHFGQKFLPEVSKTVKKYILSQVIFPKIIISNLKHAPAIGAALLVSKD
jgi:glucokinase